MSRGRRRDERGAVAVLTAVVLSLVLVMAAFGVDLGMQRVVRRDMQSLADAVAFDLVRQVDGRAAAEILASTTWADAQAQTIARNSDTTLGATPTVDVELGTVDDAYAFSVAGGATVPTAVRVTASSSVDFAFTSGSGGASRTAVAVSRTQACYKLGSWGARLSTASNANLVYEVLEELGIGGTVSAATYQTLAGAHVDLTSLAAALDVASPEALATTSVSLSTLLDAVATVVGSNGSTSAEVAALNAVRAGLGGVGGATFTLANLVDVAAGAGPGLSTAVNLADLVIGAVLVAGGNSAVDVDLAAGLPSVVSFPTSIQLVQAAKTACGFVGSTPNTSNQVTVSTTADLVPDNGILPTLLDGIASLAGLSATGLSGPDLTLAITGANASSTLDAVTCGSASRSATVGTTGGLIDATLSIPVSVQVVGLLPPLTTTVKGTITAHGSSDGSPATVTVTVPTQTYDTPYSNGGSQLLLGTPTLDLATLDAGGLTAAQAQDVLDAVAAKVVAPLVTALNSSVVGPLSDLTGLRTAGADVFLLDHPTCTSPALRG